MTGITGCQRISAIWRNRNRPFAELRTMRCEWADNWRVTRAYAMGFWVSASITRPTTPGRRTTRYGTQPTCPQASKPASNAERNRLVRIAGLTIDMEEFFDRATARDKGHRDGKWRFSVTQGGGACQAGRTSSMPLRAAAAIMRWMRSSVMGGGGAEGSVTG